MSTKTTAAALSIASNVTLIALKGAAGVITGSVAILSDAVQSTMDLLASVITFVSVRMADEPPDQSHQYGHEKLEDLSAWVEALLILLGAAVIGYQAVNRLIDGGQVESLGLGAAVVAFAAAANLAVSAYLYRTAARTGSAALRADGAHLRTDACVSLAVLVALGLFEVTGAAWIDPAMALLVAAVIATTGIRIMLDAGRRLLDETLTDDELTAVREAVETFRGHGVVGYHDLRARHVGSRHEIDLHVQFARGTTLEGAHGLAHEIRDAIASRLENSTVLVHIEPEDRVRPDRFAAAAPADAGTPG